MESTRGGWILCAPVNCAQIALYRSEHAGELEDKGVLNLGFRSFYFSVGEVDGVQLLCAGVVGEKEIKILKLDAGNGKLIFICESEILTNKSKIFFNPS